MAHNFGHKTTQMASSSAKRSRKDAKKRREKANRQRDRMKTRSQTSDKISDRREQKQLSPLPSKKRKNSVDNTDSCASSSSSSESSDNKSDSSSEEETIAPPETIKRANAIYYKVKLYSPGGRSTTKVLQQLLTKWFKSVKACSSTFVVYEYHNSAKTKAITSRHKITTNVQFLKRFFLAFA